MEITGNLLFIGNLSCLSLASFLSLFLLKRSWSLISNLGELMEEFEELPEKAEDFEDGHGLVNLSYTYRALKKQLERGYEIDKNLLNRAMRKAKEKRKVLSGDKKHHLYYAAWKKLNEIKSKTSKEGKV